MKDIRLLVLVAVRQQMIGFGNARAIINNDLNWIRRNFHWGVTEELVPVSVHQTLATVSNSLKRGLDLNSVYVDLDLLLHASLRFGLSCLLVADGFRDTCVKRFSHGKRGLVDSAKDLRRW